MLETIPMHNGLGTSIHWDVQIITSSCDAGCPGTRKDTQYTSAFVFLCWFDRKCAYYHDQLSVEVVNYQMF